MERRRCARDHAKRVECEVENAFLSADDRLMHTTQTDWERSRNIIRNQQVHDLVEGSG
jgi:hypothetical protein